MRKIKQTLVMLLAAVMLLGTVTTAMAAMGLPAFAAEDTAEENCFQTLNIPRATGSTVDKSVLLNESRLYLITDFGAVSEGDPVQNTKAINAAIQRGLENMKKYLKNVL